MGIRRQLVTMDASNMEWQRNLVISHTKLGLALTAQKDFASALQSYEAALVISMKLAATDRTNSERQNDLSLCYERVGGLAWQTGDLDLTLRSYRAAIEIERTLVKADPINSPAQYDMAIIQLKLSALAVPDNPEGTRAEALSESFRVIKTLQLDGHLSPRQLHAATILLKLLTQAD